MSDTSELGPIDPQVTMVDGQGNRTTQSIQAYLDAYEDLSKRVRDESDVAARHHFSQLEPDRIVHYRAVKERATRFAEAQLRRGMCKETGNYTKIAADLIDTKKYQSHGQVINVDEAERIGLKVIRKLASDNFWDACWRLYCLQRLAVRDGDKLFESENAFLVVPSA